MSQGFIHEDSVQSEMNFQRLVVRLWPYIRVYRAQLFVVLSTVILFTLAGRAMPLILGRAVDQGIKGQNLQLIYYLAGLYLALEVTRACLEFLQSYLSIRLGNRVLFDLRSQVMKTVQSLPMAYFDRTPVGRIVTRATNDVVSLGELFNQGFTAIFVNLLEMTAIFLALCWISVPLAVATLLLGPVMFALTRGISRKIRQLSSESRKKLASINAFTAETVNGIKVVHLYGREGSRRAQFGDLSHEYRRMQLGIVSYFARLWPVLSFFNFCTVGVSLLVGAAFYNELGLTVGELSAFVLLLQSFFDPIRVILERYNQFQNSLASADRVFALLGEQPEPSGSQALEGKRLRGEIQIRGLRFRYSDTAPWALDNIDLTIRPGESIALVGRTGSGKSSLVGLLQKLYAFQEGEILVDGAPISSFDSQSLRRRIGVVQQDNFLFRGTLASNISLENDALPRQQVLQAALDANLDRAISSRPEGLESPVDERGANLSVGEKQLIAFARVLAHDPDILILDEATANIDSRSEQLIQKATFEATRGRTSIVVAHRLSTVVACDRIVVLDHGKIVEVGSHIELLKKRGRYAELYHSQFAEAKTLDPHNSMSAR